MNQHCKLFFFSAFFLGTCYCDAQVLSIGWQRTFGGPGNDISQDIYPTADGNYILLGLSDSLGDDVNCNLKGKHDTWVIKKGISEKSRTPGEHKGEWKIPHKIKIPLTS